MPTSFSEAVSGPKLKVPRPAVARHPETIVKQGELAKWMDQLPPANDQELTAKLSRQLKLLIRDPEPNPNLGKLLRLYHDPMHQLHEAVWQEMRASVGCPVASAPLHGTVSQLTLELAYGHMSAINQTLAQGKPPPGEDIYNAMLALSRLMQWDMLQYDLTRPAIWRQLLSLLTLSELNAHNGVPLDSELALDIDADTTHCVFYGVLILLLVDPYRLPCHEMGKLVRGLGQLTPYLSLSQQAKAGFSIPVDFRGLTPPLRFARKPEGSNKVRHLQLQPFLHQLQTQGLPGDDGSLANWLLKNLQELSKPHSGDTPRRSLRKRSTADFHYVHQLSAVHSRLLDLHSLHSGTSMDNDTVDIENIGSETMILGTPCHLTDRSDNGIGFILPAHVIPPRVGDIALFEHDSNSPLGSKGIGFVGMVRRRLRREDGSHELGVEKIRGRVVPVTLGESNVPALLNQSKAQKLQQLIAPSGTYAANTLQKLQSRSKRLNVMHEDLLEDNINQRITVSIV